IALAVSGDAGQTDVLADWMLKVAPDEFLVIRRVLEPYKADLTARLWGVSLDQKSPQSMQVRATCALALYDPNGPHWDEILPRIVNRLVGENPLLVSQWIKALFPMRERLVAPLLAVFLDPQRPEAERDMASGLLVSFAGDHPEFLADLAARAE